MKNFILYDDRVEIFLHNNRVATIYLNELSGKLYFRYKLGTRVKIKHAGIYMGVSANGVHWYIHNHYETGKPEIVNEKMFTQGEQIFEYNARITNTPMQIIHSALTQVLNGKPYHLLNNNCQTLVNVAANNQPVSEDVGKAAVGVIAGLFIFAIAKNL